MVKGLVRADGEPQRFTLDHGVAQLGHVWMSALDATSAATPIISRLRDQTGETCALYVLRANSRVCVLEKTRQHVLSIEQGLGGHGEPIFRGASGKAILAFMSAQSAGSVLQSLPQGSSKRRLLEEL